jgi:ketosteroid isomerase-like protein
MKASRLSCRSGKIVAALFHGGFMKFLLPSFAAVLLVSVTIFTNARLSASPTSGADTLRQLEADFMKAAVEKGSQGYLSYYAEDAAELPNGEDALHGRENIAKTMGFLDDKNNHLTWTPVYADMAASGDLGYTYGTFEFRSKDKDGKPTVEYGKYVSIWKKQKDGSWKVVMDMGNSSPLPKL